MRVLVTGATGFVGSHIAECLAEEGHTVRVLVRASSNRRFLQGLAREEVIGDITDPDSLLPALAGVNVVVHAAGLVKACSAALFEAVNAGGTRNLLAAIDKAAPDLSRLVYVSSLAAAGPSKSNQQHAYYSSAGPITAYGRSKLKAEEIIRTWQGRDRAVIVRPAVIYGPRDSALLPFFRCVRWGFAPLLVGGRNRLSIIYVEDAARAIARLATTEINVGGKTYYLADGRTYSWQELLTALEAAMGRRTVRLNVPTWVFVGAAVISEVYGAFRRVPVMLTRERVREMAQPCWACSIEEIQADIGWSPNVDFDRGAKLTAAWYREQRWI